MKQLVSTNETEIFIPGPSGKIEALYQFKNQSSNLTNKLSNLNKFPIIGVICHPHPLHGGTMHNKIVTTIVKAWASMGLITLRFNFRGVGLSEGEFAKGQGEIEDLKSVLQWLVTKHPDAIFWLAGFSFGTFVSVKLTSLNHFPIKALLSVAPPVTYFVFPISGLLQTIPWFILQGDKDELVKYENVVKFVEQNKKINPKLELITFKDTEHFFHGRLNELKSIIIEKMQGLIS